jgi:hypothetical protein
MCCRLCHFGANVPDIYMSDLTEEDSVARSWIVIIKVRVFEAMWELG